MSRVSRLTCGAGMLVSGAGRWSDEPTDRKGDAALRQLRLNGSKRRFRRGQAQRPRRGVEPLVEGEAAATHLQVLVEQYALELGELAVQPQGRPLPSTVATCVLKRKIGASHIRSDDS
jgi:hypothetical protein